MDRHRSVALYKPYRSVGYLRWRANEYGTQSWRCAVVKTISDGQSGTRFPGIKPASEVLLSTRGATYTKRFLKLYDRLKARSTPLEMISPAYWRHLHLRLHLNMDPHDFDADQHCSNALRMGVFS